MTRAPFLTGLVLAAACGSSKAPASAVDSAAIKIGRVTGITVARTIQGKKVK